MFDGDDCENSAVPGLGETQRKVSAAPYVRTQSSQDPVHRTDDSIKNSYR